MKISIHSTSINPNYMITMCSYCLVGRFTSAPWHTLYPRSLEHLVGNITQASWHTWSLGCLVESSKLPQQGGDVVLTLPSRKPAIKWNLHRECPDHFHMIFKLLPREKNMRPPQFFISMFSQKVTREHWHPLNLGLIKCGLIWSDLNYCIIGEVCQVLKILTLIPIDKYGTHTSSSK